MRTTSQTTARQPGDGRGRGVAGQAACLFVATWMVLAMGPLRPAESAPARRSLARETPMSSATFRRDGDSELGMVVPNFRVFGPGDTVPPVTTLSTNPSGTGFQKTNVTVSLSASDPNPGSGVKEVRYSVNMGSVQVTSGSSASFVLSSDGVHSLAYWAVDNDGNVETTKFATVRIDKTAPTVDGDLLSGVLYLSADDAGSGLSQLRYTVDGGASQAYSSPVSLPT
ncbi:MAG: OmpL47-type beta-barrel domain-containing protein, partial [Armatimonadaceae bacterium]